MLLLLFHCNFSFSFSISCLPFPPSFLFSFPVARFLYLFILRKIWQFFSTFQPFVLLKLSQTRDKKVIGIQTRKFENLLSQLLHKRDSSSILACCLINISFPDYKQLSNETENGWNWKENIQIKYSWRQRDGKKKNRKFEEKTKLQLRFLENLGQDDSSSG